MGLLFVWLGTSVASFGLEIANELRVFKDAADAGYKIDINKLADLKNFKTSKIMFLSLLIPIVNIMQVVQNTIKYNAARETILDQLSLVDALEEMSDVEKQEYLKKPTGLNAILILLKAKMITLNETSIENDTDNAELHEKNDMDNEISKNTNLIQLPSIAVQENEPENLKDDLSITEQPLEENQEKPHSLTRKRKIK